MFNVDAVDVRIWVRRSDFENVTPSTFSWGTEFDGASNGSTYGYAQIVIPPGAKFDSGSTGTVTGPPWKTFNNAGPTFTYESGAFAEVGINLSDLGIDPSLNSNNPCDAPFSKILIKSRSSASFRSNLKDFAGPYDFLGSPLVDPTIKVSDPGYFICGEATKMLSPLNPYPGANYIYTTANGEFLDGTQTYVGQNAIITKPGKYILRASPLVGCTQTIDQVDVYAQPCAIDDDFGEIIENSPGVTIRVTDNDTDRDNDIDRSTLNNDNPIFKASIFGVFTSILPKT